MVKEKNRMQNVDNMYIEKSGRTNQQHRHIHSVCHQELPGLAVTEDVTEKCSGSLFYFRPMNQNKTAERGLVQYGYILYINVYILFPFTQWSLVVTVQLVSLRWGLCFFHPGTVSAVRNGTFSTWPTSACDSCTNCWSKPRHGGH